jgi:hypothetical protein
MLMRGVLVVIGMRRPIDEGESTLLTENFYRALIECGQPDIALHKARNEVEALQPQSDLWSVPVMLTI